MKAARISPVVATAFLVFVFSIPFDSIEAFGDLGYTRFVGYIFFIIALMQPKVTLAPPPRALGWFGIYTLFFVSLGIPHLGEYSRYIGVALTSQLQLLVMAWIATNLMRDDRLASGAIHAYAAAGVIIATLMFLGIGVTETVSSEGARRSVIGYSLNLLASVLGSCVLILVNHAVIKRHRHPWFVLAAVLPMVTMLLFAIANTGSRGATLATAAGLATFLLVANSPRARARTIIGVFILGALLVAATLMTDVALTRWNKFLQTRTVQSRETIYLHQFEMILERPLLGWGPENNNRELARREGWGGHRGSLDPHNLVTHILTQVGFLGGLPFLIGIGCAFRSAWRARWESRGILPLALLSMALVTGMAANSSSFKYFWLIIAYALASSRPFPSRNIRAPVRGVGAAAENPGQTPGLPSPSLA